MTETRRLPVTPEREHFHVDALAYVGPDPSNPENALFVSPGGIPFLLAIKENSQTLAGWMPDKRIAILYGTQIMTRRIDDILVTSIEQDDVIAMMHLVDESTLPSDHRERALRILADLSAGLKPEPLKLTRGTEEELDQVMADLADYFECAFNLYSATAEDDIAVDEDGIGPTALPIVLAAGNWFLPVGTTRAITTGSSRTEPE